MIRDRVKFTDTNGNVYFGRYQPPEDELDPLTRTRYEELAVKGMAVVYDAVCSLVYEVPVTRMIDIPYGAWLPPADRNRFSPLTDDEYARYVADRANAALDRSASLPDGVHVGSMFTIGVADGLAYYVVSAVKRTRCEVSWRGFGPDHYHDHYFGNDRKVVPVSDVEAHVARYRGLAKIFAHR